MRGSSATIGLYGAANDLQAIGEQGSAVLHGRAQCQPLDAGIKEDDERQKNDDPKPKA